MQITKQCEEGLLYEYRAICASSETEERIITIYMELVEPSFTCK